MVNPTAVATSPEHMHVFTITSGSETENKNVYITCAIIILRMVINSKMSAYQQQLWLVQLVLHFHWCRVMLSGY